jgi:hypothetical protein
MPYRPRIGECGDAERQEASPAPGSSLRQYREPCAAPEGRSIVVTTAAGRKGGMDDATRAALHKSMLAYSGRYRVEGNDFITTIEVSWNEEWNGTEQRRHYRIDGDTLFIESAPAPSIVFPSKKDFRRIVWVREK